MYFNSRLCVVVADRIRAFRCRSSHGTPTEKSLVHQLSVDQAQCEQAWRTEQPLANVRYVPSQYPPPLPFTPPRHSLVYTADFVKALSEHSALFFNYYIVHPQPCVVHFD